MITYCIFCNSNLKPGSWKNHFVVNHKYTFEEIEKLYFLVDLTKVQAAPKYLEKPEVDFNSDEFKKYQHKFNEETKFFFENQIDFNLKRKHKKEYLKVIKDYLFLIDSKLKILRTNVNRYAGGEFIVNSFQINAYESLLESLNLYFINLKSKIDRMNFFWDLIEFDDGSILFQYNDIRKVRIKASSSTKLLNIIKDEYFKKKISKIFY